jgi:hypothetical protein
MIFKIKISIAIHTYFACIFYMNNRLIVKHLSVKITCRHSNAKRYFPVSLAKNRKTQYIIHIWHFSIFFGYNVVITEDIWQIVMNKIL